MRGTLTGQRYVDDNVGPFLNGLPGAIFQQNNARPHTARVTQDFLRHFQLFHGWPAPRFVPCRARVGSAKTADAIVSLRGSATVYRYYKGDNLVALHFKYDQARRRFVEWAQNEMAVVPDFHKRILFSDEAHFWLNGYVNKQNCRIWSEANPQVYVETPLHPEKLTVWCALWAGGILLQKR
ncbi:hypothetical protein TNCV_985041 [Trichonephila clavipes]|nr:hypothetical protein TNCV_985041 [Trichonephila clavipes]